MIKCQSRAMWVMILFGQFCRCNGTQIVSELPKLLNCVIKLCLELDQTIWTKRLKSEQVFERCMQLGYQMVFWDIVPFSGQKRAKNVLLQRLTQCIPGEECRPPLSSNTPICRKDSPDERTSPPRSADTLTITPNHRRRL